VHVFNLAGSNNNQNNDGEGTARKQTFCHKFLKKETLNFSKNTV